MQDFYGQQLNAAHPNRPGFPPPEDGEGNERRRTDTAKKRKQRMKTRSPARRQTGAPRHAKRRRQRAANGNVEPWAPPGTAGGQPGNRRTQADRPHRRAARARPHAGARPGPPHGNRNRHPRGGGPNAGNRMPTTDAERTEEPDGNRLDALATHDQTHASHHYSRHPPQHGAANANRRGAATGGNGNALPRKDRERVKRRSRRPASHHAAAAKNGNRGASAAAGMRRPADGNSALPHARRPKTSGKRHNGRAARPRQESGTGRSLTPIGRYDDPDSYLLSQRPPPRQTTAPKVRYRKPKCSPRTADSTTASQENGNTSPATQETPDVG